MARPAWNGRPPVDDEEARERLLDAAAECLQERGLARFSVGDVAARAGVTRPTVYRHAGSRPDLIAATLRRRAERYLARLEQALRPYDDPADRIVEGVLTCLEQLPDDPLLSVLVTPDADGMIPGPGVTGGEGRSLLLGILGPREHLPSHLTDDDLDEIADVVGRFLYTLLLAGGPGDRRPDDLRGFLHRRLIPATGLTPGHPPPGSLNGFAE